MTHGTKVFAKIICPVVRGVTESCSNVPCSLSREIAKAANTTVCSMPIIKINPGMMNHCVMLLTL